MNTLTPRQAQVLDLIKHHISDTGYPPTRADIAQELGFRSPNAAEEHLKALARKGAIEMIPGTSRGIRLPEDSGVPVIGRVAAGSPILAAEHIEDRGDIAAGFFHPRADFLLRVNIPDASIELYGGGGPTVLYADVSNGSSDWNLGLTLVVGGRLPVGGRHAVNLEGRIGLGDIPDFRLIAAISF